MQIQVLPGKTSKWAVLSVASIKNFFACLLWSVEPQAWKLHWPPEPGYEGVHPLGSRSKTWGARLHAHAPFWETVATGRGQRENLEGGPLGSPDSGEVCIALRLVKLQS